MDTTTSVITTGVVVTAGRWSQEKPVEMRIFIGMGILAIFLAVMQASNNKLAEQFATLILVSAVLIYGVPIGKKLGGLK
jgi:predicted membrane channel-forming protein YqfA (hemolysin III family)